MIDVGIVENIDLVFVDGVAFHELTDIDVCKIFVHLGKIGKLGVISLYKIGLRIFVLIRVKISEKEISCGVEGKHVEIGDDGGGEKDLVVKDDEEIFNGVGEDDLTTGFLGD